MSNCGNLLLTDQSTENQIITYNWKATDIMFFESIYLYAKHWFKRRMESEWKDQLKEVVSDRISNLKEHFKSPT